MEVTEYYAATVALSGRQVIIAFVEETDCVVLDTNGLPCFADTFECLAEKLDGRGIHLCLNPSLSHELDSVYSWATSAKPVAAKVECAVFLDIWNFIGDWADTLPNCFEGYSKLHKENVSIYNRLFWGCNLPAVTPEGEEFIPEWPESELISMAEVFVNGIDTIRRLLKM